jgi:signal transduction histidine kinase/ActR/RegA family two-component response regulator
VTQCAAELEASNARLLEAVADRERLEKELWQSEKKRHILFVEAPLSITTFDRHGIVQFINPYHLSVFARDRHEKEYFVGKHIRELPGLVRAGIAPALEAVLEGRAVTLKDVYCPEFSGGHAGYFNIRGVPLMEDGEVLGGIVIREDITESRRAGLELCRVNRALKTIRACHQAMMRAADESALLHEICTSIVETGGYPLAWVAYAEQDEACRVRPVAYAGQEEGYLTAFLVSWAECEHVREPTGTAIRTGKPAIIRNITENADFASWREEALECGYGAGIGVPLIVAGETIGALTIMAEEVEAFDVEEVELLAELANDMAYGISTQRMQEESRQAEEERRKLEARLRQAQKMEAIGTLAGGVAHDFNNILAAMIGYTQLALLDATLTAESKHHLEQVLRGGDRARDLIGQILAFSRQTEQVQKPIDMGQTIRELLRLLRATLPSTIEIRQEIAPGTGTVLADPGQINQVLMNLCTNAAQAMPEKGGILEIRLDEIALHDGYANRQLALPIGAYVRLIVADNGSGMPSEIRERIFDPYFTTKEPGEGTGLGLAMVHGIVKSHRGAIAVYSEPGQGTTFQVYLPRIDEETQPDQATSTSLPGGDERILFVDDEAPLAEIAAYMLERLGYQVVTRTSSLEALATFRADPQAFDLVITDQTMPQMTGLELAGRLLAMRKDLPIILCSGFSSTVNEKSLKDNGISDYIMKPVLIRELAESMRHVLNKVAEQVILPSR